MSKDFDLWAQIPFERRVGQHADYQNGLLGEIDLMGNLEANATEFFERKLNNSNIAHWCYGGVKKLPLPSLIFKFECTEYVANFIWDMEKDEIIHDAYSKLIFHVPNMRDINQLKRYVRRFLRNQNLDRW